MKKIHLSYSSVTKNQKLILKPNILNQFKYKETFPYKAIPLCNSIIREEGWTDVVFIGGWGKEEEACSVCAGLRRVAELEMAEMVGPAVKRTNSLS